MQKFFTILYIFFKSQYRLAQHEFHLTRFFGCHKKRARRGMTVSLCFSRKKRKLIRYSRNCSNLFYQCNSRNVQGATVDSNRTADSHYLFGHIFGLKIFHLITKQNLTSSPSNRHGKFPPTFFQRQPNMSKTISI